MSVEHFLARMSLGVAGSAQVPQRILKVVGRCEWRIEHLAAISAAMHVRRHV
jgi:hypothetical protein